MTLPEIDLPLVAADTCLCGHLASDHDVVAARYCKATEEAALPRACMCPVGPGTPARPYDRR